MHLLSFKEWTKKLKIDGKYFQRNELEEEIKNTIQSSDDRYFLIVGEHGTGKTSSFKQIIKNNNNNGMIYVACPDDPLDFGKSFADAISYSSIYSTSILRKLFSSLSILPSSLNQKSPMSEYHACEEKFFKAVEQYKIQTKRTPILVIDDIHKFLNHEYSKKFLLELQGLAKELAVLSINIKKNYLSYFITLFIQLRIIKF